MNPTAKEKIKQDLRNYYASLYGDDSVSSKVRWFMWGFFQPPLTFAKLAVYIIGTTTLTTWVYASVAPESFSNTSIAVSTSVQKAVTTSLEVLHIKAKAKSETTITSDISDDNDKNRGRDDDENDDNSIVNALIQSNTVVSTDDSPNHDRNDDKGGDRGRSDNRIEVKTSSNSWRWSSKIEGEINIETSRSGKKDDDNHISIITVRTGTINTGYIAPIIPKLPIRNNDDKDEDDDRDEFKIEHSDDSRIESSRRERNDDDRGESDDD